MKTHVKKIENKQIRVARLGSASQAIGKLQKDIDLFILTYGQFSLIDALATMINQTGPAHVAISTWTAAHANLDRTVEIMQATEFLSFRMIVDQSFRRRQPQYFEHMIDLFGPESIREIYTHAKFIVIKNEKWNIVVRTSMNLNENPRLENIEISENKEFADFFLKIVDDVFEEVEVGERYLKKPVLKNLPETYQFKLVSGGSVNPSSLKEPEYTHVIKNN